jgi:hypothetical protein
MSTLFYQASIPVLIHTLGNLGAILEKAAQHADTLNIPAEELLEARLAPDMFPFKRQIQIATDHAKGIGARLAGLDIPVYEDTEASFADLRARIGKTVAFLETIRPEQFEGTESREVKIQRRGTWVKFEGQDYLFYFALPNFYFHVTTAYDILRHRGVAIGKADFIGDIPSQPA